MTPSPRRITLTDLEAATGHTGGLRALAAFLYHPGYYAVRVYRLAAWAERRGELGRLLSLVVSRLGVLTTGCYLHPASRIGPGLHLPHPVGVVIGAGAVVGENATIYQHVTLGVARPGAEAYPTLGDGVTLYSGAVLVGKIAVGDDALIGANAVVLADVPAGAVAVGIPASARR